MDGDAELLELWRGGDKTAGEALFERYYAMVERFFLNKVPIGVGDLVQETFMAVVEGRDRVRDGDKFRAYLFSIAYNVLRSHLRTKYRNGGQIDCNEISIHDLAPGPSSIADQRRQQRVLLEGLRRIPIDYQVLLELHYWEQLTTIEMAEILRIPVGTTRRRLIRARALLERALRKLEESPEVLASTVAELDDWAEKCRQSLKDRLPAAPDPQQ